MVALDYLDSSRDMWLPVNLVQVQEDTYEVGESMIHGFSKTRVERGFANFNLNTAR